MEHRFIMNPTAFLHSPPGLFSRSEIFFLHGHRAVRVMCVSLWDHKAWWPPRESNVKKPSVLYYQRPPLLVFVYANDYFEWLSIVSSAFKWTFQGNKTSLSTYKWPLLLIEHYFVVIWFLGWNTYTGSKDVNAGGWFHFRDFLLALVHITALLIFVNLMDIRFREF